jgi:hypothetical protein
MRKNHLQEIQTTYTSLVGISGTKPPARARYLNEVVHTRTRALGGAPGLYFWRVYFGVCLVGELLLLTVAA